MEEKVAGKGKAVVPCAAADKVTDASVAKHFLTFVSNKCEFVVAACWINAESCAVLAAWIMGEVSGHDLMEEILAVN